MKTIDRIVIATRREAAVYKNCLEEVLDLALTEELSRGGPLGYRIVELVGKILRRKRPWYAGEKSRGTLVDGS
jgi:hypothetical protein